MAVPADPALRAEVPPAVARAPARPAPGPAIVSRFGDISPAFAAAFGASVDVALLLGARNAEARARSAAARPSSVTARGPALPSEIPTARALPPSRVSAVPGHRAASRTPR